MLNTITVQGRLTRDPEIRMTTAGKKVANFTIACERDYKDENGTRPADFFDIVAWETSAKYAEKYLHKGDMVNIAGRLQNRKWTDRDGNNRTSTEVQASNIYSTGKQSSPAGEQRTEDTSYKPYAGKYASMSQESASNEEETYYPEEYGSSGGVSLNTDDLPF